MRFEISQDKTLDLNAYAQIPMRFEVRRIFEVTEHREGTGRFTLHERSVDEPYIKDYDAIESPREWSEMFDISNWCVFIARSGGVKVGGAVVAFDTPGLTMLEGRRELAVLWDIRVASSSRQQGIGAALFRAAEAWAETKGCRHLKVETQNINVPACRFYAKQGCKLCGIDRFAYPHLPTEIQLLWHKELPGSL